MIVPVSLWGTFPGKQETGRKKKKKKQKGRPDGGIRFPLRVCLTRSTSAGGRTGQLLWTDPEPRRRS